jgi:hypothetical protein
MPGGLVGYVMGHVCGLLTAGEGIDPYDQEFIVECMLVRLLD